MKTIGQNLKKRKTNANKTYKQYRPAGRYCSQPKRWLNLNMKKFTLTISILILTINSFSQGNKYFELINSELSAKIFYERNQNLEINGVNVNKKDTYRIKTNYPSFDTIYFERNDSLSTTIITRFCPDSTYYVLIAFSGEFDIYDTKSWVLWNKALNNDKINFDSIRRFLYQGGQVQFLIKNYFGKDTILGYYGDFEGAGPITKILKNNKRTDFVEPEKGWFVNNFDRIVIAKYIGKNHKYIYIESDNYDYSGTADDLFIYSQISCRFFNNEKILVIYDFENKETEIIIVKN